MGLLTFFKIKEKVQRPIIKGAGATLYPDKIVIATINRIKDSYGVTSANVTVLGTEVTSQTLGQTLRKHLDQSRDDLKEAETGEYKDYLKSAGFKNEREHYKNALYITIDQKGNKISLGPTINGGAKGVNRGFAHIAGEVVLDASISDKELGNHLRLVWSKCS
jgi:hypothetical protein